MAWAAAHPYPRRWMDDAGEPLLGPAELGGALASVDPALRSAALLRAGPAPGVEDLLLEALGDPVPEVRRAAVLALGRAAGPRGVGALTRVCQGDISPTVRAVAVMAIGRILTDRLGEGPRA